MIPVLASALRRVLSHVTAPAMALGLGLSPAAAQTPMGTEVVNIARVTWQAGALDQGDGVAAEARFIVARPRSQGVLTAWELDKGLSGGPFRSILFPGGDYRQNPFVPLPEPVDRSTLTGDSGPIDRSAPLTVFQTLRIRLGVPIFLTLEDAGLNLDPARTETAIVILTDAVTQDREELRFYETGADTGVFSAWINTTGTAAAHGDGQLSTRALSVITAQYVEATNTVNNLTVDVGVGPIDPFGLLFDSRNGLAVSGIAVTLIDLATGQPAQVFGDDLVASYPATVVSGGQVTDSAGRSYAFQPGEFRFPYVAPGRYRIQLGPSDTHAAPSQRSDAELQALPGAPFALVAGSRLDPFDVEPGPPLRIDIPLDPLALAQITRDATTAVAGVGDFLEYIVTVTPSERMTPRVVDTLPAGVVFVPGTLLIDGAPAVPVVAPGGRQLDYDLPPLVGGQTATITYGAQVVPPAAAGRSLPSRTDLLAPGLPPLSARHVLGVRDVLGLDRVAILGQISAGGCGGASPGYDLSGIRVLLENGEYALTDSDGRFTFRDIQSRPRVVQMDVTTLPHGARPVLCFPSTRSAGSAISQFVDLRPGLMARVEFYLQFDDPPDPAAPDRTAPAVAVDGPLIRFDQAWLDRHGAAHMQRHGPGLLAPTHGHLPASAAIDVVYLRPVGTQSDLAVNGEAVPGLRREPAIRSSDGRLELVRYRGVRIIEGRNALVLQITAADGTRLSLQRHEVLNGLRPHRLDLIRAASTLESDGRSQPRLTLRLTDRDGIPIRPGTQVSLSIQAPFGFAPDRAPRRGEPALSRQPATRTTATVGDDGQITLSLAPVLEGGTARIGLTGGGPLLQQRVPISAAARPWVLVGLAEGTLAHARVRQHMRREGEIGNALSGRVALFAEGVIRGDWLLTLRIDTAQDRDAFHGIDPDADYIVYGDRSVQGNAAQGRFPLYLRLRREGAEFLIGDFNTGLNAGGVAINQQVTGARAIFEDDTFRVMAFAAHLSNLLVEDRIPLNGTVGPYQLSRGAIVPHSQTVRLVTVSRTDASRELDSRVLQPGLDYVVSFATGQLFLRRPLPAFTPNLDRHVLVIDYEVDEDLRDGLIAGIRAEADISPRLSVGATAVHARRVEGRDLAVTLLGVDLRYEATPNLTLGAEVLMARRRFATHSDTGLRTELRADYERGATVLSAWLRDQRGQVGLTASDRTLDTTILGVSLRQGLSRIDPAHPERGWALEARLMAENDRAGRIRQRDGEVLLVRQRERVSQALGLRSLRRSDTDGQTRDLRLTWRGTASLPDDRLTVGMGSELSLQGSGPQAGDRIDLTLGYALTTRLSLFATAEVFSPRTGRIQADEDARRLTFGAEFAPVDGQVWRGAASWAGDHARSGQSLFLGTDHSHSLRQGLTASFGGDAQWDLGAAGVPMGQSIGNPWVAESFVALRAGLRREAGSWAAGADAEWRRTRSGQQGNLRLRFDAELTDSWTAGGEAVWGLSRPNGQALRHDLQLRFSAAYRQGPRDPITLLQLDWRDREQGGIAGRSALFSAYRSHYLSDRDQVNLRYGLRLVQADLRTGTVRDALHLFGAEYRRDLSERVDIGAHVALLHAARTRSQATSLGLSLGFTPFPDGWISVGYNFTGFHDTAFSANGHTDRGPFVQFRLRLDAESLRRMVQ
jgi:uncharacterized repeat protein (TIGR01451 family)